MSWSIRLVLVVLTLILLVLQYRLWVGDGSLAEVRVLEDKIAKQNAELDKLRARNRALRVEIEDLREGKDAIEARARKELGMIKKGETFYQIVPGAPEK